MSLISNYNDIYQLFVLGSLYRMKGYFDNAYSKKKAELSLFQSIPLLTPSFTKELPITPILMEGIIEAEEPVFYQPKKETKKRISLITLYKYKANFYYNPFDLSSSDYYEEANISLGFLGYNKNTTTTIKKKKSPRFWIKDYNDPNLKALIYNDPEDDSKLIDLLDIEKKFRPIDFYILVKYKEYGCIKKLLGVRNGVFMTVYGKFIRESGLLICEKPIKFLKTKEIEVKDMESKLQVPLLRKQAAGVLFYGAFSLWLIRKSINLYRSFNS